MDQFPFAQDADDESDDAAVVEANAEEESPPFDDAAPEPSDQAEDDDEPPEDDEPEDPVVALQDARERLREMEERDRARADADAQREAERQRAEREAAEQRRQMERQTAWQTYQAKKSRIAQARITDAATAAEAADPKLMAQHLASIRAREEQAADAEYYGWVERDRQVEVQQLRAERDRASVREYADYVRDAYGLPHDELKNILAYRDGTPVDPRAMSARAAELLEQRKERAALKRQLTRQAREAGRDQMRGKTGVAPGRGRGAPPQEIKGELWELDELFPWHGRRRA